MIEREIMRSKEYTEITSCRSCSSDKLEEILSLGEQNIVGFSKDGEETVRVPLTLTLCGDCSFLQLKHTTNPDLLWGGDYWYRSGVNKTMKRELTDIAMFSETLTKPEDEDIVVDIGSNDGTLLAAYWNPSLLRVGFDPAKNMVPYFKETMKDFDTELFVDYFSKKPFEDKFGERKAKIITAISMFYDLDDPNSFLQDIKDILDPSGLFVIQQNYLGGMLEQNAFDNLCHEHLGYYSLMSLESLLERNGLEVFHVSQNDINGGSFRTYIRHQGSGGEIMPSVKRMRTVEKTMKLDKQKTYEKFARRVDQNGRRLLEFLREEKARGKKIYAYGASTRGNTLLQYYEIDNELITGAAERNPDKWGLKTVGTKIPIISEYRARRMADYFLVLPWHFKDEFIKRERRFLQKGGRFIFPLPNVQVVGGDNHVWKA